MKKIRYILLLALCAFGMSACQDDLIENVSTGGADASKPVKVDLKFGIPKSMEVEVTRADNSYSGMYRARLYVFSDNTLLGEPQDVSTREGTLVRGNDAGTNSAGQYYTANNVTLYVGSQTVYAIGNTSTGYWQAGTIDAVDAAARQGLDAFKQALYTLSSSTIEDNTYPSFSTQYMPLSGFGEISVEDNGNADGVIQLKRLVSQIKFEITTLYETRTKTVTFEPSNYTFRNIATQGYVMEDEGNAVLDGEMYDANPVNIAGAGDDNVAEFSAFIPENIQTAKQPGAQSYNDRESFSGQGDDKDWTYAPKKGTYVVISGVCTEKDSDGNLLRYGNVEYTIHLGDFSASGSMDDFSVERNCIYTYKVSVQGMDKIKVEAEKQDEEYQNGAEGNVIEMGEGSKMFNLDAHYEQVFVEYNLSDILETVKSMSGDTEEEIKDNIAQQFLLAIHTPMNTVPDEPVLPYSPNSQGEEVDMEGIDYKWIEFYPQSASGSIALYPGKGSDLLYSPYEVCRMMGDAIYQLYRDDSKEPTVEGLVVSREGGDYVVRFTIFIDEYFYTKDLNGQKVAWDKFTRQDPRTMMIASEMQISDDLNSTYSKAQTYISQRAIQTFYNPVSAGNTNALGLETYNENGVMDSYSPERNGRSTIPFSDDWSNGRANMLINMGIMNENGSGWSSADWDEYINFRNVGYTDDNSISGNRWSSLSLPYAYYACMSRNRDLNGDGIINQDEVRWYLPALSQYLRIGIGVKALPAETRLFTGEAATMNDEDYPDEYTNEGTLYFVNTSISANTNKAYTLYWAVEVGAYGSPGHPSMVRCVRNLPMRTLVNEASGDDDVKLIDNNALADPVYGTVKHINDGDNILFDFEDRLVTEIYRNTEGQQWGPYIPHNEVSEGDEMKLSNAFVVASQDLYVPSHNPYISLGTYDGRYSYEKENEWDTYFEWSYSGLEDDPCSSYYENGNKNEIEYWRTPNLNELMIMSTVDGLLHENANTYSRTQFTLPGREVFYYNTSGIITTNLGEGRSAGYIRCVRDATQAERDAAR